MEILKGLDELKLRKQLKYLFQYSPFYRKKFNDAGIGSDDIKRLEDLALVPFTVKQEIRDSQKLSPPLGAHVACSLDKVKRIYLTSGTTGTPTVIGLTKRDLETWVESSCRAQWASGVRASSKVVMTIGAGPFIAGVTYDTYYKIGACVTPLGPGRLDRVITALQMLEGSFVLSTPSYAVYLIDCCLQREIEPSNLSVKHFIVSGEPGGGIPIIRNHIEETYGAEVTETMGNGDICIDIWMRA